MPEQKHFPKKTKWSGERYRERMDLMPLIPVSEISRRTGITKHFLGVIERPVPLSDKTKLELIERFERDPKTEPLLMHPKLWALARIRKLAPTDSGSEIREVLLEEMAKLRSVMGNHWNPTVPSAKAIVDIIRETGLKTAEEKRTTIKRISQKRRTRKPNQLSERQKVLLIEKAANWLSDVRLRNSAQISSDELFSGLLERFQYESERVPLDPLLSDNKLTEQWIRWIERGFRNYKRDVLRKSGIKTRSGNLRRAVPVKDVDLAFTLQERNRPVQPVTTPSVSFNEPLTPAQKKIMEMAMAGMNKKQIANRMNVTTSAVWFHLNNIRKKARKV